jgi:hypothetical protein
VADELDPVTQRFVADLTDYVEPIEAAALDTEEFAEAVKQARDAVYEMYPGIDDATASLIAEAAAADDAAASMEYLNHEMDRAAGSGDGLYATLKRARDELADMGQGGALTIGKTGWDRYATSVDTADEAMQRAETHARDLEAEIHRTGIEADEAFLAGKQAASDFERKLGDLGLALEELERGPGGGGPNGFLGGGISNFLSVLTEIPGMAYLIAGLIPVVAGLLVLVDGVVTGFAAAALGVGAFALFAIPAIKQITGAYTTLQTAQEKVNQDRLAFKADPSKANAQALKTALRELQLQEEAIPGPIRAILGAFDELKQSWERDSKKLDPVVFTLIGDALKIANPLLQGLLTWAETAAGPIETVANSVKDLFDPIHKLASDPAFEHQDAIKQALSPWEQFVKTIQPYIKADIPAIASGFGRLFSSLQDLFTVLSPKDTANAIGAFFGIISGGIRGVANTIRISMSVFDHTKQWWNDLFGSHGVFGSQGPADMDNWERHLSNTMKLLAESIGAEATQLWDDVKTVWAQGVSWVESHWDALWSHVTQVAHGIPGRILSAIGNLGGLLVSAGSALIEGLIHGIEGAIPGLESAVNFVRGLMGDLGLGGGGGSLGNITHGVGSTALGAVGSGGGGGGGGTKGVSVKVAAASAPEYHQALQRHVQAAVLDFAQANPGALLALPGR